MAPKTLPRANNPCLSTLGTARAKCTLVYHGLPRQGHARMSRVPNPRGLPPTALGENGLAASDPARDERTPRIRRRRAIAPLSLGPRQPANAGDWRRSTPRRPARGPHGPRVSPPSQCLPLTFESPLSRGCGSTSPGAVDHRSLDLGAGPGTSTSSSSSSLWFNVRSSETWMLGAQPILAAAAAPRTRWRAAAIRSANGPPGASGPPRAQCHRGLSGRASGRAAAASAGLGSGSAAAAPFIALRARRRRRPWGGGAGAGGAPRTPLRTCPS